MKYNKPLLLSVSLSLFVVLVLNWGLTKNSANVTSYKLVTQKEKHVKKLPREARKKARAEYEWELMRDPATNVIPRNARLGELAWKNQTQLFKTGQDYYNWVHAGPNNVGGRTRALAIDAGNPSNVLAGGVSGGIWKSTNRGSSWTLKTPDYQNLNVTWIAQDTRTGEQNTWYAATGELLGNSAGSPASGFRGYGIFKSTDNGESWTLLPSTVNPDITVFNSEFDYISRIIVSPTSGSVFAASAAGVVLRSTDGGASWEEVLGEFGNYLYVDIVVASSGKLIACLSADGNGGTEPGLYVSTNNGDSWTNITPNVFPSSYERVFMALAPSNQDILYVLMHRGNTDSFFHINLSTNIASDRTPFMPNMGGEAGDFEAQGGYNYIVAVHPTDENFVIMGGTNLYRSTNGYTTPPKVDSVATQTEKNRHWIGGYSKDEDSFKFYNNHHPDQHGFVFDPATTNGGYSSHDGGISYSTNLLNSSVFWAKRNNNYHVTQFYHGSISRAKNNKQLVGGAQDNGSPFFSVGSARSEDASSGDGAYSFFGTKNLYVSSQNGNVIRYELVDGTFQFKGYINPDAASGQLFIHPFEVDKNNEFIVYYPSKSNIYRTNDGGLQTTTESWTNVGTTGIRTRSGLTITAIESSVTPAHIVYFGGTNRATTRPATLPPYVYKWTNADTSKTSASITELTLPNAPNGAYVSDIAINPADANEVIVTLSNYNIEGIFYTNDGTNFVQVEGNLRGDDTNPGPSIRSATIATINNQKVYLVGTTTGLYATTVLDGNNTVWVAEATATIGNAIVNTLSYRESDGHLAAFTHGRGAFYGEPNLDTSVEEESFMANRFELRQNYPNPFNPSTTISFELKSIARVQLNVYDINGRLVRTLLKNETRGLGVHSVQFDASNLASGTYVYSLQVFNDNGSSFTQTKKMTLIK